MSVDEAYKRLNAIRPELEAAIASSATEQDASYGRKLVTG